MSYKSDFENDSGWSAVDTNIKLNNQKGKIFRDFLKTKSVNTIIRYYASTDRPKTITKEEAKVISADGFNIIPVFQDRNREPSDFGATNGKNNARSAAEFAAKIGQPDGTLILFAADADFTSAEINNHIIPYFEKVKSEIGSKYKIGAYGSGAVLTALVDDDLIDVQWMSMSRLFLGTKELFYSNEWALRQVPPDQRHGPSDVTYDKNILGLSPAELGAFQISQDGAGVAAGGVADEAHDAVLGGVAGGAAGIAAAGASNAYVSTEGLNLREQPNGTIIAELTIGQGVVDQGAASVSGWRNVMVNGRSGAVFGKYLRQPSTPQVEALLEQTIAEWVRFDKGMADEKSDPYYKYVGQMWESIGEDYDGRSLYPDGREVPWSAAFISYVVRRAGSAYAKFAFAAGHAAYSHDAIQARILGLRNRPFWGYRRTEAKPVIGDIIHRNRDGGSFTYDYAENHSTFESHADIVVEVTEHVARVIGGNVGDTVSIRRVLGGDDIQEYALDSNGFVGPNQNVIAILKNRASEVS